MNTAAQIDALRSAITTAHAAVYTPSVENEQASSMAVEYGLQTGLELWEIAQAVDEHMDDTDGGESFLASLSEAMGFDEAIEILAVDFPEALEM